MSAASALPGRRSGGNAPPTGVCTPLNGDVEAHFTSSDRETAAPGRTSAFKTPRQASSRPPSSRGHPFAPPTTTAHAAPTHQPTPPARGHDPKAEGLTGSAPRPGHPTVTKRRRTARIKPSATDRAPTPRHANRAAPTLVQLAPWDSNPDYLIQNQASCR